MVIDGESYDPYHDISVFNQSQVVEEVPLYKMWKEDTPGYRPFLFDEGRRRELEQGPNMSIIKLEGFNLTLDNLSAALGKLSEQKIPSLRDLIDQGVRYSQIDPIDPGEFDISQVVGTYDGGWSGLVEGMGKPRSGSTPSVGRIFKYVKWILAMGPYKRREFIRDIGLSAYYDKKKDGWQFWVSTNGRHRMMTFKALADLGCTIKFTKMKVNVLGDLP